MAITPAACNDFWLRATGYFLGPILNGLPALIVPARVIVHGEKGSTTIDKPAAAVGLQPLLPIYSWQALAVIGVYALVFAVVSIDLTWRRDVVK